MLFDLIRSLTKSEKRFIKIYASRYMPEGKNKYLELFDTIDKIKKYDEKKLNKKIKNSSCGGNLEGIKNYLHSLILDCLDLYHKDSCIDRRINGSVHIARVLSEKRLDEQGNKLIKKTKKISDRFNRFENTISLTLLQKDNEFRKKTVTHTGIRSYYQDVFSAIESMKMKFEYNKIYDELRLKRQQAEFITDPDQKEQLETIYSQLWSNPPAPGSSFDTNMYYLLSGIEYARILMDAGNTRMYIRKIIALFENNTHRIADNTTHYIYALDAFISQEIFTGRGEADSIQEKISSIPSLIGKKNISSDAKAQVFQAYYIALTRTALLFRDYAYAIPHIQRFEIEKKKYQDHLTSGFCLESNIACIYFGAGLYKQALKWCNAAISRSPKTRDDGIDVIHILNLLVHYELKNEVILPGLIKSTYNSLHKSKRNSQFIIAFFKYLCPLLRSGSENEQRMLSIRFKEEILSLPGNNFENDILKNIDIPGWLDKKIESVSADLRHSLVSS